MIAEGFPSFWCPAGGLIVRKASWYTRTNNHQDYENSCLVGNFLALTFPQKNASSTGKSNPVTESSSRCSNAGGQRVYANKNLHYNILILGDMRAPGECFAITLESKVSFQLLFKYAGNSEKVMVGDIIVFHEPIPTGLTLGQNLTVFNCRYASLV